MSKRTLGMVINLAGIAILFVALAADPLGLGGAPGIGWKQWSAAFAGVLVAFVGTWLMWTAAKGPK